MNVIQVSKLQLEHTHEYLLVPYFEETNIKSLLQRIGFEDNIIEMIASKQKELFQKTILLPLTDKSITLLFMNMGSENNFSLNHLFELFQGFGKQTENDYQIILDGLNFKNHTLSQVVETMVRAMYLGAYTFSKATLAEAESNRIFSIRDRLKDEKNTLTFTLVCTTDLQSSIDKAVNYGECINYARMLGDIPNNYLHVEQFAEYASDLSEKYQLTCEILGDKELKVIHSGGILGVNAGSTDEAKLITLYYEGCKEAPVTALIGKGVMFDSGGTHLKSISGMDGMKYDMCGAANVLSAFEIAVRQKSKKNILAVMPAVENLLSPSACKMGDVLTTMSGKTVEVYNTDAEGRLILCDAITYAIKKGADSMIDLATLTYSCQRTFGTEISGVFSNNDDFCEAFAKKAKEQCEKVWRLPLDDIYHKWIHRTQTADIINYAPGCDGGASVAACFLEEFVENEIPWIHLDIVGTAVNRSESKLQSIGATGVLAASIAAFIE